MPPKTADGTRAASEAASEGGGSPTNASAAAAANTSSTSKPTKKGKGKAGKGKGAAAPPEDTHRCFHCQTESTKMMCCSQCRRAWYCGKPCQKKHWKYHKRACGAAVAAEARRATVRREATEARGGHRIDKEMCVICVSPVVAPVELPCGHAYCGECLSELRSQKVAQACPMCRAELPPGLDGLWDLAFRTLSRLKGVLGRGNFAWKSLPPAEQEEMGGAVAMLTEASAQGHMEAQAYLGAMYRMGFGVAKDYAQAFELTKRAALLGDAKSQCKLGVAYRDGHGCEQSYERAVELWTKAAEQGNADAQCELGSALMSGEGAPQNLERAFKFFKLSADQGHITALANTGMCYRYAHGVDMSVVMARRYYELAAENGFHLVRDQLKDLDTLTRLYAPRFGQRVLLVGLNTEGVNGKRGTVVDFSFADTPPPSRDGTPAIESGLYTVRIDGQEGRLVMVRVANVTKAE